MSAPDFSANEVDDCINAIHRVFEADRAVVNDLLGAKGVHRFNVAAVGRRNDSHASLASHLHGIGADTSSGTMNEHRLTGDQLRLIEQRLVRGDGHDRNGSSLRIGEANRLCRDHADRGDGVLGVGAGELPVCYTKTSMPGFSAVTAGPTASTVPDNRTG